MGRPIKFDAGIPGLKQMSDSDLDYPAHQTLVQFASINTGTGTLSINPGVTTGLTLIGSITDTRRPYAIGDHPVDGTNIVSTTYNFYQDLQSVTNSPTARPLEHQTGTNAGLKEQPDTEISAFIANSACARIAAGGLGSYRLETSSPVVGGTWVAIGSITNQISGNTTVTSNNTTLWRRTDQTAPTTVRPLKLQNSGASRGLKQMNDTELQGLNTYTRNRIVSSGVGQYKLQSGTPIGGTWVQVGTAFSDTRQQVGSNTYTGSYTGGSYQQNFTGGTYNQDFTGGNYQRNTQFFFAGFGGPVYVGFYSGFYTGSFSGGFYTGTFTGGSYAGGYASNTIYANTETISTVSLWLRTA